MTLLSIAALASQAAEYGPPSPVVVEIESLLDLIGLAIAIWTLWSTIWLHLGGQLQRAFRLISLGALAFALSHLLDSILRLLDLENALLIHQGAVLIAMLLFVPGLASLADALPTVRQEKDPTQFRFWPLAVGLVIVVSGLSFILYGASSLAETWAFFGLDGGLILLSATCLAMVLQARLGGAIGRSLWQALIGLLIFSLAHPFQIWLYEETTYNPDLLAIMHRLTVIPAFFLFASSITSVGRNLKPMLGI